MSRSLKKGPYIEINLENKVLAMNDQDLVACFHDFS